MTNISNLNEVLNGSLESLYDEELKKLMSSIEVFCKDRNPRGIEQTIGRRFGFFWESAVRLIFKTTYPEKTIPGIFFSSFVDNYVKEFIETHNIKEKNVESLKLLAADFFESSGTAKQDLCDLVFELNDKRYAIDAKWRFYSNDAKTVRQIAFSAKQLISLKYIPILLIRRPANECLVSPLNRFAKSGWTVLHATDSSKFLLDHTGFHVDDWIKNKVKFWDSLSKFHKSLRKLGKDRRNFDF